MLNLSSIQGLLSSAHWTLTPTLLVVVVVFGILNTIGRRRRMKLEKRLLLLQQIERIYPNLVELVEAIELVNRLRRHSTRRCKGVYAWRDFRYYLT